MNYSNEHIDELIGKYLAGEAEPQEAIALDEWRSQSAENERYFKQLEKLYDPTWNRVIDQEFNADRAWQSLQSRVDGNSGSGRVISMKTQNWRVAASLAAIVSIGVTLFFLLQSSPVTMKLASAELIITDTLPQGDIVHLNRNSSVNYKYDKGDNSAHIALRGEAFFDLRNPEQKTVVQTGKLMIRDIGTKFNVKAYQNLDTIEVIVTEGEVALYTEEDDGIRVTAGEKGFYVISSGTFEKVPVELANDMSWKTRNFHFNNATLREVANTLNAVLDIRFIVEQSIENCRITVQFYDEDPEHIAEIIAETLGLEVEKGENQITLIGQGCEQ